MRSRPFNQKGSARRPWPLPAQVLDVTLSLGPGAPGASRPPRSGPQEPGLQRHTALRHPPPPQLAPRLLASRALWRGLLSWPRWPWWPVLQGLGLGIYSEAWGPGPASPLHLDAGRRLPRTWAGKGYLGTWGRKAAAPGWPLPECRDMPSKGLSCIFWSEKQKEERSVLLLLLLSFLPFLVDSRNSFSVFFGAGCDPGSPLFLLALWPPGPELPPTSTKQGPGRVRPTLRGVSCGSPSLRPQTWPVPMTSL